MKYEVTLTSEREVKHSVLYKGEGWGGVYVPKSILPTPAPMRLVLTLTEAPEK